MNILLNKAFLIKMKHLRQEYCLVPRNISFSPHHGKRITQYHKPVEKLLYQQLISKVLEQKSEKHRDGRCQAYSPDDLVLLLNSVSTLLTLLLPCMEEELLLSQLKMTV